MTAQYALRAIVFLAKRSPPFANRMSIAEATLVPNEYLQKVLNGLEVAGIVSSKRGPGGGYALVGSPEKLTVYEVVTSFDSIPRIKTCPLGISEHQRLCPLHQMLDDLSAQLADSLRTTTISDLMVAKAQTCGFPMVDHE